MKAFFQRLALSVAALILALMMVHIALVMLALGLYFALEQWLGTPAALAVSALIFLFVAGLGVYFLTARPQKAQVPAKQEAAGDGSLASGLQTEAENFVRRHPVGSLSGAFATGFIAGKSPTMLGRLLKGLMSLAWMRAGAG